MKTFILWGGAVLVLVVAISFILVYLHMGQLIKAAIETAGPKITQCDVTVADITFRPLRGKLRITDLVIGNPEGFKTASAFRVKEIRVAMTPKSVFTDRVQVQEVTIDSPEITYEIGMGKTNIGTIQKNVERFLESVVGKRGEEEPDMPEEDREPGKKVMIDLVSVENGKVNLSGTLLRGEVLPIPLPTVQLRDIGQGKGISTAEAAAEILNKVLFSVVNAVKNSGQILADAAKDLGDTAKKAGEGLKKSVGGLFGGMKDALKKDK